MSFKLGECVEPSKSIPSVSSPSDIQVCFTLEELQTVASDFHANNFEFAELHTANVRNLEMHKRDVNIMLKLLYAIEANDGEANG